MQQKSLFTYWLECFTKHYADFSGRARRSEYWGTVLFNGLIQAGLSIILSIVATILFSSIEINGEVAFSSLFFLLPDIPIYIYSLIWLLPGLAVAVRRLHDIGKSGWNLLWILLPIVGAIMLIYWYCQDSQLGENKWGANPKLVNPE